MIVVSRMYIVSACTSELASAALHSFTLLQCGTPCPTKPGLKCRGQSLALSPALAIWIQFRMRLWLCERTRRHKHDLAPLLLLVVLHPHLHVHMCLSKHVIL